MNKAASLAFPSALEMSATEQGDSEAFILIYASEHIYSLLF